MSEEVDMDGVGDVVVAVVAGESCVPAAKRSVRFLCLRLLWVDVRVNGEGMTLAVICIGLHFATFSEMRGGNRVNLCRLH